MTGEKVSIMSEKATQQAGSDAGLEAKVESRAGAAITVTRIKAAISDRIAAAKSGNR